MLTWKCSWGFYWYRSILQIEIPRIGPLFYLMFDVCVVCVCVGGRCGWIGVGVDMCAHVGTGCVHTCVWRPEVNVFSWSLFTFTFLRQGLSLKPNFITSARLPVSFRIHLPLSLLCLSTRQGWAYRHMPDSPPEFWDLNSDPHSCTVSTLPKDPFLCS